MAVRAHHVSRLICRRASNETLFLYDKLLIRSCFYLTVNDHESRRKANPNDTRKASVLRFLCYDLAHLSSK